MSPLASEQRRNAHLRAENETLREQIAQLRALLAPSIPLPLDWRLTAKEAEAFRLLLAREVASPDALLAAMYLDPAEHDPSLARQHVRNLRMKLRPFGIEIRVLWGHGYALPREVRDRFRFAASAVEARHVRRAA